MGTQTHETTQAVTIRGEEQTLMGPLLGRALRRAPREAWASGDTLRAWLTGTVEYVLCLTLADMVGRHSLDKWELEQVYAAAEGLVPLAEEYGSTEVLRLAEATPWDVRKAVREIPRWLGRLLREGMARTVLTACPSCGRDVLAPSDREPVQCGWCRALLAVGPSASSSPGNRGSQAPQDEPELAQQGVDSTPEQPAPRDRAVRGLYGHRGVGSQTGARGRSARR